MADHCEKKCEGYRQSDDTKRRHAEFSLCVVLILGEESVHDVRADAAWDFPHLPVVNLPPACGKDVKSLSILLAAGHTRMSAGKYVGAACQRYSKDAGEKWKSAESDTNCSISQTREAHCWNQRKVRLFCPDL